MNWFIIGGVSFILAALLSEELARDKNGPMMLLGISMLLIGILS